MPAVKPVSNVALPDRSVPRRCRSGRERHPANLRNADQRQHRREVKADPDHGSISFAQQVSGKPSGSGTGYVSCCQPSPTATAGSKPEW